MFRINLTARVTLFNMLLCAAVVPLGAEQTESGTNDFAVLKHFQALASRDPAGAAEQAAKLDASRRPVSVLNVVLEHWTAKDADAAMQWARTLPKSKEPAGYIQIMGMSGRTWPTQFTWCREHAEQIVRFHSGKPVVDAPPALRDRGDWYWDRHGRIVVYTFDELKQVTDEDLAHVGELPHLQTLNIISDRVTNEGLAHLASLKQLSRLSIRCPQVNDEGLRHLTPLQNLVLLDLGRTSTVGPGLDFLARLPQLRNLTLSGSKVTDAGLKNVRELDGLIVLQLSFTFADAEGGRIVKSDAVDISDASVVHLGELTNLRRLDLRGTGVSAEGAKRLKKSLAKTEILYGLSSAH
jgi:hypothetical protein